jgi:PAS domain S-box-containing protein
MGTRSELAQIITASDLPGYLVSCSGTILLWSRRAEDLYEYSSDEMVGSSVYQIIPEIHSRSFAEFRDMLKLQPCIKVDAVRQTRSGRAFNVQLSASRIVADGEDAILVFARPPDTDRQSKADQLASIIQNSSDAIMSVSADGVIKSWNAAAQALLGYNADEIVGQATSILFPTNRPWARGMGAAELAKGNRLMHDTVRRHKNGAEISVSLVASPLFSSSGAYLGYTVILRDLGQKKRSMAALRDAEQFNQRILQASKDWISVIDPLGRVMFTNQAGAQAAPEITAGPVPWRALWPEPDARLIEDKMSAAFRGEYVEFTATRQSEPSQERYWAVSLAPITDESGAVLRLVAIARDVTAERRHRAHLDTVNKELSHRVKNVLAVVSSMARTSASEDDTITAYQERFSSRIRSLAKSHDLLVRADWVGLEISELVEAQLRGVAGLRSGNDISSKGPPIRLKTQPAQMLGIALHELVTNAMKYGALSVTGGRIDLAWSIEVAAGGERGLVFVWEETLPATIAGSDRKGFGSEILEEAVADMLFGSSSFELRPSGARWQLSIPDISPIVVD